MEIKIIKALLKREFYNKFKPLVFREYFTDDLVKLYDLIGECHTLREGDIELDDLAELFHARYPQTRSQSELFGKLITGIKYADEPDIEIMTEIVSAQHKKHIAQQIISAAVPIMNDGQGSFSKISELIQEQTDERSTLPETDTNIRSIFEAKRQGTTIPFGIASLEATTQGAGPGNVVAIFGRPESGKTSFAAYQSSFLCDQGLKVLYCANEEPASAVVVRIACAYFGKTEAAIQRLSGEETDRWNRLRSNLSIYDATGWDLDTVDGLAAQRLPDAIVLDQVDKFGQASWKHGHGPPTKDYERLGSIWTRVRTIAKQRNTLIYNITQASAEAAGKRHLTIEMMARSRTDKGAEVDLAIGVGMNPSNDGRDDGVRYLNRPKNKITGNHEAVVVLFDPATCSWME